jgi:acetolactate synthase-1/2/3 large subunit
MKIPVVSKAGLPQGYFPEDDPLFAGVPIGFNRPNSPAQIVPKADLIVTIGSRYEVMSAFPKTSPDARVIQIDIEPTEIGRFKPVEVGLAGDAKVILGQLARAAKELGPLSNRDAWLMFVREERQKYEESIKAAGISRDKPIKAARLVREIEDFLDKEAYVIIDGADTGSMGRTYLRAKLPGHLMIAHGDYGNMGPGVAFALGVKLSRPQNQVLVLTSDGSFGFNAMELETASKYHIKFVVVVCNNRAWGAEWGPATRVAGKAYMEKIGVWLPDSTRYDKLAEALGCYGELVVDPEEIRPALKRAFETELPALLDVRVAQEDMWPTRTTTYAQLDEYLRKAVAK